MFINDPFSGPRLKIRRARSHFSELDKLCHEFCSHAVPSFGDYDQINRTRRFSLSIKPSEEIPLVLGDVAHNLRSALDILVCDLARLRKVSSTDVKFPFGSDREHFEKRVKDCKLHRIGDDIVQIIRSIQPYKGGNTTLRDLHDLDIQDKHQLIVPVGFASFATIDPVDFIKMGMMRPQEEGSAKVEILSETRIGKDQIFGGIRILETSLNGQRFMNVLPGPGWDPHPITIMNETDQLMPGPESPFSYYAFQEGSTSLCFPTGPYPFSGQNVLEAMKHTISLVEDIVGLFEANSR